MRLCSLCRGPGHTKRTCAKKAPTVSAVDVYKMSADEAVLHATEDLWREKQLKNAARAKAWEEANWMSREALQAMSVEEYAERRFYNPEDKKGRTHLRNMVASTMQSDKSTAGKTFEDALLAQAAELGLNMKGQTHVNAETKPVKKRKDAVHTIDGYIAAEPQPNTMKDCYVISKKTTLRERWNQDVWCVPYCKKVLILTRETPNQSTLASMQRHGVVCIYPNAAVTDSTWSYDEFFARMKRFQEGATN